MRGYPQPCVFVEIFYHVRQNCGICCRQQCFRTYTTQKRSKKERTPSLKAGIAFVILLVLQVSMGDGDHLPSELLDSKVSGNWLDEMRAKIFDLVDDHGYVGADPYIKKLVEETEKKQNLLLYVEVKKDGTANINFQTSKRSASQPVGAVYGRCLWVAGLCYVVEDFRKVQIQDIDVDQYVIGHLMGDQKSSTSSFYALKGTLSRWSRLHLQLLEPVNPHWARVELEMIILWYRIPLTAITKLTSIMFDDLSGRAVCTPGFMVSPSREVPGSNPGGGRFKMMFGIGVMPTQVTNGNSDLSDMHGTDSDRI
ncbi:hypothetical protein evm_013567 [Chilo suppressalis]|nr:hypothetical protein evm_013567 [Chilo suppressalis]